MKPILPNPTAGSILIDLGLVDSACSILESSLRSILLGILPLPALWSWTMLVGPLQ